MIEEIGKVKLDYSRYPGKDFYCDGGVEDDILKIVKERSADEYGKVIEESLSWPILYHLSPLRENIIDWIPMKKTDRILEVGSGCGAITGALSRKAGSVTCVDLSKKRSEINAYRHRECDNVTIHVGNFKDIEPELETFDFICLIGVFEYAESYLGGKTPFQDFIRILLPHLAEGGRLILALENKYGLKYFAGCKEDHLGTWFSGIENYADGGGVRTFSRNGLEKILKSCGVREIHFYYPYPDYKFMTALYSDAYLPGRGELSDNHRNFDRDRMLLFDEKNAFDGISEDGLFPVFSNSFLAVAGPAPDVKFVKYSNDRAPEYAVRTEIGRSGREVFVRKYPLNPAAREHVRGMAAAYEGLKERYAGGKLEINRCALKETGEELYAQFEFVQGIPLSELMDRCLERNDLEGFYEYFREYVERIGYGNEYPVADFDLIFSNLLVDQDRWTLIDYEWTFGKPVETAELAYRAVYCYLLENEKRKRLNPDLIRKELNITEQEAEYYREQERDFQKFVTGNRLAMAEIRERIGKRVVSPQKWIDQYQDDERVNRVQIYEDRGEGFSEKNSFFLEEGQIRNESFQLTVGEGRRALRIDPCSDSCIVMLREVSWNGEALLPKSKCIVTNGFRIGDGVYAFVTKDPNITLQLSRLGQKQENLLKVSMQVTRVPEETVEHMQKKGWFS